MTPVALTIGDARGALYLDGPSWQGRRTAAIGELSCGSVAGGAALLEAAGARARDHGAEALIGPMNGNTWHSYRVVIESDGSAPFLLEPVSGGHDLGAFEAAGFRPIQTYVSARAGLDEAIGLSLHRPVDGIAVQAWDGSDVERWLVTLFEMSSAAFAANPFYQPITLDAFRSIYRPLLGALDRRMLLFATDERGEPVGFLLGYPDYLEGASPRTVVLKTYASSRRGVGRMLGEDFQIVARDLGFTHVIHALMHERNESFARSRLYEARTIRRYAVMGRLLTA